MVAQLDGTFVRTGRGRSVARLASYLFFEGRPVTTRGRVINPVVLAHARVAHTLRRHERVREPIFVVGLGRSGTTLLGTALGTHPYVGFLNEPKALWHAAYPDEDVIGSYSTTDGRLILEARDATEAVCDRLHAGYAHYLWVTRSSRVVDKYPELVYRLGFVREVFPDAHFIAMVRDPADVVASVTEWCRVHGNAGADWWGVRDRKWRALWAEIVAVDPSLKSIRDTVDRDVTDHRVRAAVEWLTSARATWSAVESGIPVHVLRYEDLLAEPSNAVSELLRACDLPDSPRVVAYLQRAIRPATRHRRHSHELPESVEHAVSSLAMRFGYIS